MIEQTGSRGSLSPALFLSSTINNLVYPTNGSRAEALKDNIYERAEIVEAMFILLKAILIKGVYVCRQKLK